ncbi:hypothetical protein, partial [Citrobacter freundii]|uniref:hypothetical protein n=1 Tax=Citrobacter freundii TaxID=546 RepID=UPI001BD11C81
VFYGELTKACHRSRKYSHLGGGIWVNSCQNRRVLSFLLHYGHDSTTLKMTDDAIEMGLKSTLC